MICLFTGQKNSEITNDLRKWAANYNIAQTALKAVVKVVNHHCSTNLHVDPRTIMRTPRKIIFKTIGGSGNGKYWHQGFETCLRNCFKNINMDIFISININIDGLPIHKSNNDCFWPILFNIQEFSMIRPMAIGIFYGDSKPDNAIEYLTPFVREMKQIIEQGLEINGFKLSIRIRCFICDSPARAFIKGNTYFEYRIIFSTYVSIYNVYIYCSQEP